MKVQDILLLIIFLVSIGVSRDAEGQNSRFDRLKIANSQLHKGMTFHDVIGLWGPPDEKQEFETKREDMWRYGELKVFFSEGKVLAWTSGDNAELATGVNSSGLNPDEMNTTEPSTKLEVFAHKPPAGNAPEVKEILGEIMRDVSSEESGNPTQNQPGNPALNPSGGSRPFEMYRGDGGVK